MAGRSGLPLPILHQQSIMLSELVVSLIVQLLSLCDLWTCLLRIPIQTSPRWTQRYWRRHYRSHPSWMISSSKFDSMQAVERLYSRGLVPRNGDKRRSLSDWRLLALRHLGCDIEKRMCSFPPLKDNEWAWIWLSVSEEKGGKKKSWNMKVCWLQPSNVAIRSGQALAGAPRVRAIECWTDFCAPIWGHEDRDLASWDKSGQVRYEHQSLFSSPENWYPIHQAQMSSIAIEFLSNIEQRYSTRSIFEKSRRKRHIHSWTCSWKRIVFFCIQTAWRCWELRYWCSGTNVSISSLVFACPACVHCICGWLSTLDSRGYQVNFHEVTNSQFYQVSTGVSYHIVQNLHPSDGRRFSFRSQTSESRWLFPCIDDLPGPLRRRL